MLCIRKVNTPECLYACITSSPSLLCLALPPAPCPTPSQVVIIAAGYDTRAYRLSKPGVRFYEIDLPHASKHKQELVRKLLPVNKVRCGLALSQQSRVRAPR